MKSRVLVALVAAINLIALAVLFDSFAWKAPSSLGAAEKTAVRGGQCYETVMPKCEKVNTICSQQECVLEKIQAETFYKCQLAAQYKTIPNNTQPECKNVEKGAADCLRRHYPCFNGAPCMTEGLEQCKRVKVRDPKNPKKVEEKYYCRYVPPTKETFRLGSYAAGDPCPKMSQRDLPVDTAVARANGLEFEVFHD